MFQNKPSRWTMTFVLLLAMIGLSLGLTVYQSKRTSLKPNRSEFHGTWLDQPRTVSAFDLMGTRGPFNPTSLLHHWTMMFFGFTTCPSICPVTMAELSQMMHLLKEQGVQPLPQVVLVSLDPAVDTVEKLHQYVTAFYPDFIGVTGTNEAVVKTFAQEMGVTYTKLASSDPSRPYQIEHSGTIMLFNPKGELTAFFTMPHQAVLLAKDYRSIVGR